MLKNILRVAAALIIILIIVIALQPTSFQATRTATIYAPPQTVFALVNNFHQWEQWSPWAKMDPDAKTTYAGPESGVGATTTWDGNKDVGAGTMTIVESKPNEYIKINLDFTKPMKNTSTTEFTFKDAGNNQTQVVWNMIGNRNFIAKAMSLVIDCEKMVGEQFEKGLNSIKSIAEASKTTQ